MLLALLLALLAAPGQGLDRRRWSHDADGGADAPGASRTVSCCPLLGEGLWQVQGGEEEGLSKSGSRGGMGEESWRGNSEEKSVSSNSSESTGRPRPTDFVSGSTESLWLLCLLLR